MTSLIGRAFAGRREGETRSDLALSFQQFVEAFQFGGLTYGGMGGSLAGDREDIASSFSGYVDGAFKSNGIVFACIVARMLLFSEARFQYQSLVKGRPGDLFGSRDLDVLETPWPGGTTRDLLSRVLLDVDLGGNSYTAQLRADRLVRMRPDWVTIMLGSTRRDWEPGDLDTEVVGYLYHPGGPGRGRDPVTLLPEQVAHFAPIPDPTAGYRGMSWITPIVTEVMGDKAAMEHKLRFFDHGATVNLVVTMDPSIKREAFERWVQGFKDNHEGSIAAYKTLFLGGGADIKAIGADMKQIDFKIVQGHGETRVCAAARVPPIVVGLSEGLDSATYSNYGQARRAFGDLTMRPLWGGVAGAFAPLVRRISGSRLWYDGRDIPFLQEDVADEAAIQQSNAATIATLVREGFTAESSISAVVNGDMSLLVHSGLLSVQLHPPGTTPPDATQGPAAAGENGRRLLDQFVQARS